MALCQRRCFMCYRTDVSGWARLKSHSVLSVDLRAYICIDCKERRHPPSRVTWQRLDSLEGGSH